LTPRHVNKWANERAISVPALFIAEQH